MSNHEFHGGSTNPKKNKFMRRVRPLTSAPSTLHFAGHSRNRSKYLPEKEDEKHQTQALEAAAQQIT